MAVRAGEMWELSEGRVWDEAEVDKKRSRDARRAAGGSKDGRGRQGKMGVGRGDIEGVSGEWKQQRST